MDLPETSAKQWSHSRNWDFPSVRSIARRTLELDFLLTFASFRSRKDRPRTLSRTRSPEDVGPVTPLTYYRLQETRLVWAIHPLVGAPVSLAPGIPNFEVDPNTIKLVAIVSGPWVDSRIRRFDSFEVDGRVQSCSPYISRGGLYPGMVLVIEFEFWFRN